MKKLLAFIFLLFPLIVFARPDLYICYDGDPKISILDTSINKIIQDIKLKFSVNDIKLDYEDKYLYFISSDTNSLYRLQTKNYIIDTDFINVGLNPAAIAISKDNKKIYVVNKGSKNITIVKIPSMELSEEILPLSFNPKGIIIADDNRRAFVSLDGRKGIAVIDLMANKVKGIIDTGIEPWGMCIYQNKLFVTNEGVGSVSVIDINTYKVLNEIVTSDLPRGVDAFNNQIYIGVTSGIDIFETVKFEKPASLGLDSPGYGIIYAKTTSGDKIYVASHNEEGKGEVAVIDPYLNEIVEEIPLTGKPNILEIKKPLPTATPTFTSTKTQIPTATFTLTKTPIPTATPTSTKVPVKKKIKPKPTPTIIKGPDLITTDLKGKVWLLNGPASYVKVKAISKHTNKIYETKTDHNGNFIFNNLPIGGYVVSVEATYIKEKAVAVVLNRGENEPLVISVQKR